MSNVNIRRAVDNIRGNTTVYTPVVEMIVNAIQAIEETGRTDGKVLIRVIRGPQLEIEGLPSVLTFEIEDNGIGFTDAHRLSFDTLYSDKKISNGGKGFGRFICLKYFEDLLIESVYREHGSWYCRSFSMGKQTDIIVGESVTATQRQDSGTLVTLRGLKKGRSFDKRLQTIARNLVEQLLPYFITKDYTCPEIVLSESDGSEVVRLNDFVSSDFAPIQEIGGRTFAIEAQTAKEEFLVRVFKLYAPRNQKSRISLVAHKREVPGSVLQKYIPEFEDEFYDTTTNGELDRTRNYIIKAYVFGDYLDRYVSLERSGFEFGMERNLEHDIGQIEIERNAAHIAKAAVGVDITQRQEKKRERVQAYVDKEAPWHKELLQKIDLSALPYQASHEEIEACLQREKFSQEAAVKRDVAKLLEESDPEKVKDGVPAVVSRISDTSKNDLIHYVMLRKTVLELLAKSFEHDQSGAYPSEGTVHDIIFPRKNDSDRIPFEDHNLWILDERFNFTTFVSSDVPLYGKNTERPDLIVYNKRVLFRGDNQPSNPITIFEFKKPQRDDFANPSSHEDPVQQLVRYVNDVRDGKYKTPEGRKILVSDNTPFYGYVVCDLTPKVERWLEREKQFTPMPDRMGWFQWMANSKLHVEVLSWEKVLADAKMRNQIFFYKLGI